MLQLKLVVCAVLVAFGVGLAGAQTPATAAATAEPPSLIRDLLEGKFGPATIPYTELPPDMKAVEITMSGLSNLRELYSPFETYGASTPGRPPELTTRVLSYLSCSWTNGKAIGWNGVEYIAVYRAEMPPFPTMVASMNPAADDPLTHPFQLRLRLVRMDGILSMSPHPELSRDGWLKLVADLTAGSTSGAGSQSVAVSNMKQLGQATLIYCNDYDDVLPFARSIGQAKSEVMPYLKNMDTFKSQNPNGGTVLYNVNLAGVVATTLPSPASTPVFYDSLAWPGGGRPVVFADGHADFVEANRWNSVAAELARKYARKAPAPPTKTGKGKPRKP